MADRRGREIERAYRAGGPLLPWLRELNRRGIYSTTGEPHDFPRHELPRSVYYVRARAAEDPSVPVGWVASTLVRGEPELVLDHGAWLLCDGARHLSADYPELAQVIRVEGRTHWAAGEFYDAETFRVPDMRRRFARFGVIGELRRLVGLRALRLPSDTSLVAELRDLR